MATHCSILAWEIPWTEVAGRLQSTESDLTEPLNNNQNDRFCLFVFVFLGFFGHTTYGILGFLFDQGSNLCPLQWEHRLSTTGPPGKPQNDSFLGGSF